MRFLAILFLFLFFYLFEIQYSNASYEFNDSHFHVSNYVQKGISLSSALKIMDKTGVKRSAVFGIPLQQRWNMYTETKPSYYLHDDADLYYYSAVDAFLAMDYLFLPKKSQERFDPMITGFNPTDGYAIDHIRKMLETFPGVFSGIGEFSIKKEVVSSKISGAKAQLSDPALKKIFKFAKEVGLVVIFHSDIDSIRPVQKGVATYFNSTLNFFKSAKKPTVIWAHTGLGRYIKAGPRHHEMLEKALKKFPNLYFDISWDLVGKEIVKTNESIKKWGALIKRFPKRFIYGSDTVSPSEKSYLKELRVLNKLWETLPKNVVMMVKKDNYERIFNRARLRVRSWEKKNIAR